MLKLSVITDEVSQDLGEAIAFAQRFDLAGVELRSVWERGPFAYTKEDIRAIRERLADTDLQLCAVGLPFYKCALGDMATREAHLDGLKRTLEWAVPMNITCVRGFSFWQEEAEMPLGRIVDAYAPVPALLKDAGVRMAIEPDPSIYAGTATTLMALLSAIGDDSIQALWDGGNLLFHPQGENPLDGYSLVRPRILHVHIKDARLTADGAEAVRIGTGSANVRGQLEALRHDGYTGWASLETHYRLTRAIDEDLLKQPGGSAFTEGGLSASTESMESLQQLIKEVYGL